MSEPAKNAVVEHQGDAPPPVSETTAVLEMIERAARDPEVNIDKLERLWVMRERMMDRAAEQAFNVAMAQAQADMPQVFRDATNDHTKSAYARLETICKAIMPVVTKHGFFLSFDTEDAGKEGIHRVTCMVGHSAGHSKVFHADLPADVAGSQGRANKTPIQGFGSTVSYGRRYLTLMIFNVALANEDDDAEGATELITEDQVKQLRTVADEVGADIPKFCQYLKVESLAAIPAAKFDHAMKALAAKQRKGAAA